MTAASSTPHLAYSIAVALQITGLGRTSLYKEISSGRLVAHKVGRRTLISADDLERWLKSQPTIVPHPKPGEELA